MTKQKLTDQDLTALVVLVPEAEELVLGFWREYTPKVLAGIFPHITILIPFVHPDTLDQAFLDELSTLFRAQNPIAFTLGRINRFPQAFYLEPDPPRPFIELTEAVCAQYPGYPPYRGEFADIVPHLTVIHSDDAEELAALETAFAKYVAPHLPIRAQARAVWLLEKRSGRWRQHSAFGLGEYDPPAAAPAMR